MNKITYTIVFLFLATFGFAQTDSDYENTLKTVADGYNNKDSNAIFGLFSSDLQSTISLDQLKALVEDTYTQKGKVVGESTFLVEDDSGRRYLSEFENASSVIVIQLSQDMKISKFAIEEY
ncbi:hypothetical protein [Aquimarina algicola]|uniref:DUF3887 domain-containing protein n=1 Tax=Aquimarina algicola TaxID=2589995 RepID=A0A504JD98_9FLAO|nr:hypothetical protein [Aquimarina algicola]TPN88684.1 hypothetical protein FHK87_00280 [Aquimarina algicola]